MLVEIRVTDDAEVLRIEADEIPADADVSGADRRTWYQQTGDAWLERAEALVLIAPSLVVPKEWNAMLNPAHPRMADVTIVASEPFRFDPRLATPRRHDPRTVTPAGTISIGGVQAGVQCLEAPSGWHLLGRTPVRTYHPRRDPVFLVEPGDAVTCYAIDASEWSRLDAAAEAGEPVAELVAA